MAFVGVIGLCYGFEVFLVHPDWHRAFVATILPTFDLHQGRWRCAGSVFAAVGMLGATVMPHVIYLHSALVQPRLSELEPAGKKARPGMLRKYLRFELVDVFVAMNGAWLINSAMIIMAAVVMYQGAGVSIRRFRMRSTRWGRCWDGARRWCLRWRCCARGCRARRWG